MSNGRYISHFICREQMDQTINLGSRLRLSGPATGVWASDGWHKHDECPCAIHHCKRLSITVQLPLCQCLPSSKIQMKNSIESQPGTSRSVLKHSLAGSTSFSFRVWLFFLLQSEGFLDFEEFNNQSCRLVRSDFIYIGAWTGFTVWPSTITLVRKNYSIYHNISIYYI